MEVLAVGDHSAARNIARQGSDDRVDLLGLIRTSNLPGILPTDRAGASGGTVLMISRGSPRAARPGTLLRRHAGHAPSTAVRFKGLANLTHLPNEQKPMAADRGRIDTRNRHDAVEATEPWRSRSKCFITLPDGVRGSASSQRTDVGHL